MKKITPNQIVLIVAVAGVWGFVGYKAYNNYFGSTEEEVNGESVDLELSQALTTKVNNGYQLSGALYRDPFLGKTSRPRRTSQNRPLESNPQTKTLPGGRYIGPNRRATSTEKPAENIVWPSVTYKGVVENPDKPGTIVGMINVNGLDNFFERGYQWRGVKAIAIYSDSVLVEFQGERKSFRN